MDKIKQLIKTYLLGAGKYAYYRGGHYYSPIVNTSEIKNIPFFRIRKTPETIAGIDLRASSQLALFENLLPFLQSNKLVPQATTGKRYYQENDYFGYADGLVLQALIRYIKPKRIIEVGSGYSSALMLDVREEYANTLDYTCLFIEPYPERLNKLLHNSDAATTTLLQQNVQQVQLDRFKELESGDILFIDSSHVMKTGSDLHYLMFEVLPVLQPGVYLHFHDIFYPFEYPVEWILQGRSWNEGYMLRAFLMHNAHYQIELFGNYIQRCHPAVAEQVPDMQKSAAGSIWLRKLS